MSERTIPISKKQSDLVDALAAKVKAAQEQLQIVVSTLIAADPSELPPSVNWETRNKDGVFTLVILLPDPPAPEHPPVPALVE